MAAAVAASLAAGGEEAATTTSVPGSPGLPGSRSAERALEEAVATGTLNLSNRRLKHFPRGAARSYDLSDITQAELGDLPLVRLDFSCNRVSRIPVSFCRLRHLQVILLDSNPLQSPPAQSTDEFSELSFRISELAREPRGPRERREDGSADGDPEQVDFIDSHVPGEDEERGAGEEQRPPESSPVAGDGERAPSSRREEPSGEERRRPDTLQLWQERERRQQQQSGVWGSPRKDSFPKLGVRAPGGGAAASSAQATYNGTPKSSATQLGAPGGQGAPTPASTAQEPLPTAGPGPSSPDSVLRPRRSPQLLDEKEVMAQLRQVLESQLQQPLPEDLAEALASGVILCQLANQLRPRSVPFIHVPSPAVPKLSALKSRKNVESFLEACRKMGVPEADLCSPSDLLQGTAQGLWTTLEAVKRAGGRSPPPLWPPSGLGGFILFYMVLMLLLCVESLCQPHHILEEEGAPGRGLPYIAAVIHALLERP
ncbi:Leucine-rich repeat and calponin homology domain-containing protein 4, partial [Eschrichtius robustus]|nr:Leucine-rich repeat and calponin homology domain-containing protein 4 [Eschrichtius robustus]